MNEIVAELVTACKEAHIMIAGEWIGPEADRYGKGASRNASELLDLLEAVIAKAEGMKS